MVAHRLPKASSEEVAYINMLKDNNSPESHLQMIYKLSSIDTYAKISESKFHYKSFDANLCDAVWESMGDYDYSDVIKNFKGKSLLVTGKNDFIYREEQTTYFDSVSEYYELDSVGHHPYVENKKKFFEICINFIMSNNQA